MESLKPCPFCGNNSADPGDLQALRMVEDTCSSYGLYTDRLYFIRCGKCFSQGGSGVTGYNGLTGTRTDDEQARRIAINKWNRRQPDNGKD